MKTEEERCAEAKQFRQIDAAFRKGNLDAFYAYRSLAWALPAAWVVLPPLYLPGIPSIGNRIYAYIASRRTRACAYSPGAAE